MNFNFLSEILHSILKTHQFEDIIDSLDARMDYYFDSSFYSDSDSDSNLDNSDVESNIYLDSDSNSDSDNTDIYLDSDSD